MNTDFDQIDALMDKLNDISDEITKLNNKVESINDTVNELMAKSDDKISDFLEYNDYELPRQNIQDWVDGYSEYSSGIEVKKIMFKIANLTSFKDFICAGEKHDYYYLAQSLLTHICTNSYLLQQVPNIIEELNNKQKKNFINYYNSFRTQALIYGILSQYDDVKIKINSTKEEKHNAIDLLLDNIFILKQQNDWIISKIYAERTKSEKNYNKQNLIEQNLIEYNDCFDFDYITYKAKWMIYAFFHKQLSRNYTIQQEVEILGFTLDFVITNISTKKPIIVENEPLRLSNKLLPEEEQRQRILEVAGWKFYRIKYADWINKKFDCNKTAQDIIKLLD